MYVFVLRFESRPAVQRAFAVMSEDSAIESCSIELEDLQIRFLAPAEIGVPVVERVHERGGLVWCTRNALVVGRAAD